MGIETVIMVDWSARSAPSPAKRSKDAIFVAERTGATAHVTYCRTRAAATEHLVTRFEAALSDGRRVLAGFDFPLGYPRGFAHALTGRADPFAIWDWLADAISDDERGANNRLEVADRINAQMGGAGPFWSHPKSKTPSHVPFHKPPHQGFPFAERRQVEKVVRGASTCFQLYGNGAVASQTLLGLPRLQMLRRHFGAALAVRPFEDRDAPILLAEVYPSILSAEIKHRQRPGEIPDAAQVRVLAQAFAALPPHDLDAMLREGDPEEGWIAGVGHAPALIAGLA
ncbi:molybdopterin guanine dinucleotide synthesis [Roseicyclus sp.]|uniref:molybdopterin guanine dinucleotide synthesis n=1 Tax=Roseicyclus sp. TaxID=1914329 RepID=UPI003F6A974E